MSSFPDANGRDPGTADRVVLQYLHFVPGDDADYVRWRQRNAYVGTLGADRSIETATANWLTGTVEDIVPDLAAYERQGFDEVIVHPVAREPGALERQLRLYDEHLRPALA